MRSSKKHSGGVTLHQPRHSSLSHDAEAGTGAPMLMAKSGHRDIRSLARYARVSTEALAQHQTETDPHRR
jgi:integrase/recombinase XerD